MKKIDFNDGWLVQKDGEDTFQKVTLPHDAMIYEKRSKDAVTAGASGYFEPGKYIYKKEFRVPEEWAGKNIVLEFEAVYQNAQVYVNGEQAAVRPYGYSNFFVEISELLKNGESNQITVIADNAKAPNSRWYSGSGIYREVQLYTGSRRCISPEGVKVTVEDGKTVHVDVQLFHNENAEEKEVLIDLLDGEKIIASGKGMHCTIQSEDMKPWDAEHPNLYQCRVRLLGEGGGEDEETVSFGMRTIAWNGNGFLVNGKPTLLRGACIHHDNGILGACAFRDAERRRVKILKEAGFNAIRSAHNPVSKAMLDACDELGMYLMDESFDMWLVQKNPYDYGDQKFREWWKEDISAMISKDYNHPSVVMYSIGNEISELGVQEGRDLAKEMADYVRGKDGRRAVTMGMNLMLASMTAKGNGLYDKGKDGSDKGNGSISMDSTPTSSTFNYMMNKMGGIVDRMSSGSGATKIADKMASVLDISGYNYATSRYQKECRLHPDRVIVGSETLPKSLFKNWQMVKEIPNLIGDFMWTGWDYLGESGIGTIRYVDKKSKESIEKGLIISGGAGIIDICGKVRPEAAWSKLIWGLADQPVIAVEPVTHADDFAVASMWRDTDAVESWSWEGCEGKRCKVLVYADAEAVSLSVNGKTVGRKKVRDCKTVFKNVTYEPGTIEAAAYDKNGNVIHSAKLQSAVGRTEITLTPDKTRLRPNGQDLCFLNIDLTDSKGIVKSSSDQKLTVRVEGPADLQAFGSARPAMEENFVSDTHTTFYGKALAVIRANKTPGVVKVTVSGNGLQEKTIELEISCS